MSPEYLQFINSDDREERISEREFLRSLHSPPGEAPESYLTAEEEWYEAQYEEMRRDLELMDELMDMEAERLRVIEYEQVMGRGWFRIKGDRLVFAPDDPPGITVEEEERDWDNLERQG